MYNPNDPNPEDLPSFQWPAQSNYGKEMRKWNKPYVFQRYPAMVYKAHQLPGGKWATSQPEPPSFGFQSDNDWNRACQAASVFTTACQRIVQNDEQYRQAYDQGWRDSPTEAMVYCEGLEKAVADAAAHRHFEDQRLGEKAKVEAKIADESTADHLPEIPEKRRGRPKKIVAA